MTDAGAGARGGSTTRSGMHDSVRMAHGSIGWASATEVHGTEACECVRDRAPQARRGAHAVAGWLGWSIGPLGPGDGSLVHHPR
jgi:hypothetical protein